LADLGWQGVALCLGLAALVPVILVLNDRTVERWWSREPQWRGNRGLRRAWQWRGRPPRSFTVLATVFAVHLVLAFLLVSTIDFWAAVRPDANRTAPIRMRGGRVVYAAPVLAHYVNMSFSLDVGILVCIGVVMWLHRKELERIA
jgi:hypothetical protein